MADLNLYVQLLIIVTFLVSDCSMSSVGEMLIELNLETVFTLWSLIERNYIDETNPTVVL